MLQGRARGGRRERRGQVAQATAHLPGISKGALPGRPSVSGVVRDAFRTSRGVYCITEGVADATLATSVDFLRQAQQRDTAGPERQRATPSDLSAGVVGTPNPTRVRPTTADAPATTASGPPDRRLFTSMMQWDAAQRHERSAAGRARRPTNTDAHESCGRRREAQRPRGPRAARWS
jgi:hypothetical protein